MEYSIIDLVGSPTPMKPMIPTVLDCPPDRRTYLEIKEEELPPVRRTYLASRRGERSVVQV